MMTQLKSKGESFIGGFFAILAFGLWGLLPVYWKALREMPAPEVLSHRILWSAVFLAVLVGWRSRWKIVRSVFQNKKTLSVLAISTLLIGVNWFIYIWAVNSNYIVETSLGYYISPLLSVLLGRFFLSERLRPFQWIAVGIVTVGVLYQTFSYGRFPWIAISLGTTFGFYGLLKKKSPLDSISSLFVETSLLVPLVLIYLFAMNGNSIGNAVPLTGSLGLLIVGAGIATSLPLVFFGEATKRLRLSTLGIFQYLGPTMNLLIGVFMYGEVFTASHFITFGLIWVAVIIYASDSYWASREVKIQSKKLTQCPVYLKRVST